MNQNRVHSLITVSIEILDSNQRCQKKIGFLKPSTVWQNRALWLMNRLSWKIHRFFCWIKDELIESIAALLYGCNNKVFFIYDFVMKMINIFSRLKTDWNRAHSDSCAQIHQRSFNIMNGFEENINRWWCSLEMHENRMWSAWNWVWSAKISWFYS